MQNIQCASIHPGGLRVAGFRRLLSKSLSPFWNTLLDLIKKKSVWFHRRDWEKLDDISLGYFKPFCNWDTMFSFFFFFQYYRIKKSGIRKIKFCCYLPSVVLFWGIFKDQNLPLRFSFMWLGMFERGLTMKLFSFSRDIIFHRIIEN